MRSLVYLQLETKSEGRELKKLREFVGLKQRFLCVCKQSIKRGVPRQLSKTILELCFDLWCHCFAESKNWFVWKLDAAILLLGSIIQTANKNYQKSSSRGIRWQIGQRTGSCVWSRSWPLFALLLHSLLPREGILRSAYLHFRVIIARVLGLSLNFVESLTFSQFCSRRPLQDDPHVWIIRSRAREIFLLLPLSANSQRNIHSRAGVLHFQIGSRPWHAVFPMEAEAVGRRPFSFANGIALGLHCYIFVLGVVLNVGRITWLGEGERSGSRDLYFLLKLMLGEVSRWLRGE